MTNTRVSSISRSGNFQLNWQQDAADLGVAIMIMNSDPIEDGNRVNIVFARDDGSIALLAEYFDGIKSKDISISVNRMRFVKLSNDGMKYKIQCRMYDGISTTLTD